jgi:hypothetical protein
MMRDLSACRCSLSLTCLALVLCTFAVALRPREGAAQSSGFPNPTSGHYRAAVADFEEIRPPGWTAIGNAGFDLNKGFSHNGLGNAWVRATTGWNAMSTLFSVFPSAPCVAQAWVQLSPNITDGYMSVRSDDNNGNIGNVVNEVKLAYNGNGNYQLISFAFTPPTYTVQFYVGMFGNGKDAWERIDDVAVACLLPN